jgi:hypothetical protein
VFGLLVWEKRLSPRRASAAGGSLLSLFPRRTQVRLTSLLNSPASADLLSKAGETSARKSTVCGISGILPRPSSSPASANYILNPSPLELAALAVPILFPPATQACLRFQTKNMQQHIFQFVSELDELQNTTPLTPSSHCSSVQERLMQYGSGALDSIENRPRWTRQGIATAGDVSDVTLFAREANVEPDLNA